MPEKPEWTPGPWEVEYDDEECQHVIRMATARAESGSHYTQHVIVYDHGYWDGDRESVEAFTEAEANAALIAAAPDLYEACEAIIDWYDDDHDTLQKNYEVKHAAIEKIRAALAKARGEA